MTLVRVDVILSLLTIISIESINPKPIPFFSSPNAVLRLRFNHFAAECSWDHMYVYDGDSAYAPLNSCS